MSIKKLEGILDNTVRIKISETERYPFIQFEKVEKDADCGEFVPVMLVNKDKVKRWTEVLIEFEKMQDELSDLQELFYNKDEDEDSQG